MNIRSNDPGMSYEEVWDNGIYRGMLSYNKKLDRWAIAFNICRSSDSWIWGDNVWTYPTRNEAVKELYIRYPYEA